MCKAQLVLDNNFTNGQFNNEITPKDVCQYNLEFNR